MEKCRDHINNGSNQLTEKDSNTKVKAKIVKQLKALQDNEFIDDKSCQYLKPSVLPEPRFYGPPKIRKKGVPISLIVSYNGSPYAFLTMI